MNSKQALADAATAAKLGRFEISRHFRDDRAYRNVTRRDLACAMMSALVARRETDERWVLSGGSDVAGDALTVVVAFDGDVIVVTAFAG
jgi:hypothetical protein